MELVVCIMELSNTNNSNMLMTMAQAVVLLWSLPISKVIKSGYSRQLRDVRKEPNNDFEHHYLYSNKKSHLYLLACIYYLFKTL